uniref:Uncharacterized protein n=1 Tax=Rhodnius prolixus TaxID=13249 RepID=T1HZQ3_RHOPR
MYETEVKKLINLSLHKLDSDKLPLREQVLIRQLLRKTGNNNIGNGNSGANNNIENYASNRNSYQRRISDKLLLCGLNIVNNPKPREKGDDDIISRRNMVSMNTEISDVTASNRAAAKEEELKMEERLKTMNEIAEKMNVENSKVKHIIEQLSKKLMLKDRKLRKRRLSVHTLPTATTTPVPFKIPRAD